ncbi:MULTISPECIES: mechanosensitive ion channel family protein [Micromonospora]|uniref:Mechanosensitive ion channel protein MscS n=2 Tax=Micromonospora TaxID=1873 RepID=A0A9X0LG91_9ACTN|nr:MULTISPECIES: mechanosensitive ion channel domain-containing protein [Micromonospora]AEB43997.1 mscs mechanosensitive ion channel [Micromonospora maris AB-18-032]KUJ49232.1 mechanosensitive ion channel protein MscS [Micromonospora maris]MBL6279417.1 mechanosensitive ion channel [Micromonospora fiedleri]RUL91328.1 mechanosensitive ion channel family protein [Verrucosispora sp. FIM060022]WSK44941.1 mechanosensitive ion channel family protein [Micromonospora maris]
MHSYLVTVVAALVAAAAAVVVVEVVHRLIGRWGRRSVLLTELAEHAHRAAQVTATVLSVQFAVRFSTGYAVDATWRRVLLHLLVLAVIAAGAWLVAALLVVVEDTALARFRVDVPDNRHARRVRTQVVMLRRVTIVVIVILTLGVMLMTFPAVRGIGAGVLTSAGVVGIVAALAAQSLLGNLFAGLQLAFSDAVRLDDVVVVEGEWGRIEELTLSYVVVQIWDDRRLILPTSYFTSTPFQNWTRTEAAVLGTAEFEVDWSVPVQAMREELRRLVEGTDLWDGRVCVLQVTDATGGMIKIRALVSAASAGALWDLRCLVREHLVAWVRDQRPTAMPRLRAEVGDGAGTLPWQWVRPARAPRRRSDVPDDARLFGGSDDGEARSEAFVGPDEPAEARH